jgi:hypothetical protein
VQLAAVDDADAGHAVGPGAFGDGVQPLPLLVVQRHQDLADLVVGEALLGAEVLEQADPAAAQQCLERAGLVVEAGVDDAAVAAGLVRGEPVLLLEEGDLGVGSKLEQPSRHCRTDDAAADDGVALDGHRAPIVWRPRGPRPWLTVRPGRAAVMVCPVSPVTDRPGPNRRAFPQGSRP